MKSGKTGFISNIFLLAMAILCNAYFVAVVLFCKSGFLGTVFGFPMIWFLLSIFFIFLFLAKKHGLLKKIPRAIRNAIFVIVGAFVAVFASTMFFVTNPKLADGTENVKYAIILGGGITKNLSISDNVKERMQIAAEYLKNNPEVIAVVTGGQGRFFACPESKVLKPYLTSLGIDESRILEEDKAKDTIQNFIFSAKVLSEHENVSVEEILASPIAIITSDAHLSRSEKLAKRIGYKQIYGIASKTPPIYIIHSYTRESFAFIKLGLRIVFTHKPTGFLSGKNGAA